jgi:tRNA pseudouridine32 synthase/23S rRNA pseudouridine746 synthase
MAIANTPSKLSLPQINPGVATVLDYLIATFPAIAASVWLQRAAAGKLHWHDGTLIDAQSAFRPQQRVYYYREVAVEPVIPFSEQILFQDQHLLLAFKPHFLPVTPGGAYVNECLQTRLRASTGIDDLQALHRLDRVTAGLVLFSVDRHTRYRYHQLFEQGLIEKTYQAVAQVGETPPVAGQQWLVENRLQTSTPRFLMHEVGGRANSSSHIRCVERAADKALFQLKPSTGKTHQLRLHMQSLGWPILHDRYYPLLQA